MDSECPFACPIGQASDAAESRRFTFGAGTFKNGVTGDRAASVPSPRSSTARRSAEGHGL